MKSKVSVGDKVRISKKKEKKKKLSRKDIPLDGRKRFLRSHEVKRTSPVTYKIADLNGEEITGTFYEPELQ